MATPAGSPRRAAQPDQAGYFDIASGEPLHPAAREVLLTAVDEGWADPARLYGSARRARLLLDNAREVVAAAIGARPDEVAFTSSGTQAIHLGVLGAFAALDRSGGSPRDGSAGGGSADGSAGVVVSAVEHSSVLQSATQLASRGVAVRRVGVDRQGLVDVDEYVGAVTPGTGLACLQAANHEVGTVQPVDDVAAACRDGNVPLLVDAAQAVGRVELPEGWSLLAASAHKWGGPAGVGVLGVRRGVRWRSPMPYDERERGRAAGFENVPGVLAAAAALRARVEEMADVAARHAALVDHIRQRLTELLPDVEVVGHPTRRLPHLVTFSCLYVDGEALVIELDRAGFAVSSGSSCTSSTLRPSHVLEAMGVVTHGNVRVSLPRDVTRADVDRFLTAVTHTVTKLRQELGNP